MRCKRIGLTRCSRLSGEAANAGELVCAKRRSRVAHTTGSLPSKTQARRAAPASQWGGGSERIPLGSGTASHGRFAF